PPPTPPPPPYTTLFRSDLTGIGAGDRLQRAADHHGLTTDIKVYPEAGHSFANELPAQPLLRIAGFGYNAEATEDAWARVFAFFRSEEHTSELQSRFDLV